MVLKYKPLSDGEKRAAVVLVALGAQLSADVMKHLPEAVVERLTYAILGLRQVTPESRQSIAEQLVTEIEGQRRYNFGGMEYAREVLIKAIGRERAEKLLSRVAARNAKRPFDFLADIDPAQLSRFLQEEHPQTSALILAHLPPILAARVCSCLPEEQCTDVVNRIGMMDRISPDVVKTIESGLQSKLSGMIPSERQGESIGGVNFLVSMLNQVDRSTEKQIMEELHETNPELAEQVQAQMFVFEDLTLLDNRSLELVLREVDKKDLLLALRGANEEVRNMIFANISKRAAAMMQEDLEVMGPVRLRTVEEAQKNIVMIMRKLEQEEKIVLSRGGSDDILV